jgi:hypothetical protein
MLPHDPFDPMQPAGEPFRQHIVPDASYAIGTIAALEASVDRRPEHIVVPSMRTGAAVEPGVKARPGDIQSLA